MRSRAILLRTCSWTPSIATELASSGLRPSALSAHGVPGHMVGRQELATLVERSSLPLVGSACRGIVTPPPQVVEPPDMRPAQGLQSRARRIVGHRQSDW